MKKKTKNSALITCMERQEGGRGKLIQQLKKAYQNHELIFQECDI